MITAAVTIIGLIICGMYLDYLRWKWHRQQRREARQARKIVQIPVTPPQPPRKPPGVEMRTKELIRMRQMFQEGPTTPPPKYEKEMVLSHEAFEKIQHMTVAELFEMLGRVA